MLSIGQVYVYQPTNEEIRYTGLVAGFEEFRRMSDGLSLRLHPKDAAILVKPSATPIQEHPVEASTVSLVTQLPK